MGDPHNYCLGRKETGRPRLLFHAAVPRLPALSLGRQRSPRPESKVRARGPAESSALERYARERPEHKAARSRPATAPGPGPPRAHGARANTMHPGLGRGSCGARPWDFLVNRSRTPRPHPHPLPRGFSRGLSQTTSPPAPPPPPSRETRRRRGQGGGDPRGRWPRAWGGKGEQGARWGVGRRAATQRNSLSLAGASGATNLLSPGPRVFSRPTSGSRGRRAPQLPRPRTRL